MSKNNIKTRINKYLGNCGVCSRREADRLIEAGRVTIDGAIAIMGMTVSDNNIILIDDKPIKREKEKVLIALNKPVGIECTANPDIKNNIVDYVDFNKRIYPIGRLDKRSEGLILMTNEGELVNNILKASNYHEKEYIVTVDKKITPGFLTQMSQGVPILDTVTRPCVVKKLDDYTFSIILTQGLNKQIRRMCDYIGYNVITLKRIRIMNIHLGDLETGKYRDVTENEIKELKSMFGREI